MMITLGNRELQFLHAFVSKVTLSALTLKKPESLARMMKGP